MQLAWWNWSIEKITENLNAIATGDLGTLKNL